jgi:hypothetical protein
LLRARIHAESVISALPERQGVRTFGLELRGDAGLVAHFDQKRAPAFLDQFRPGRALRDSHAAFGVDVDVEEAIFIERVLNASARFRRVRFIARLLQRLSVRLLDRRAEVFYRFDQASDLSRERLQFDLIDFLRLPRRDQRGQQ